MKILTPNYKKDFNNQRSNARIRNVEWQLTFEQWFYIWEKSGNLTNRGRGNGKYVIGFGR